MAGQPVMLLEWGIRASFLEYVESIPESSVEVVGAERRDGVFRFPARTDGSLEFIGRIRLLAHGGELDVSLSEPAVEEQNDGVVITGDIGGARVALARLLDCPPLPELRVHGGMAADVALTMDGAEWLGGVYGPWARVDPVRITPSSPRAASSR